MEDLRRDNIQLKIENKQILELLFTFRKQQTPILERPQKQPNMQDRHHQQQQHAGIQNNHNYDKSNDDVSGVLNTANEQTAFPDMITVVNTSKTSQDPLGQSEIFSSKIQHSRRLLLDCKSVFGIAINAKNVL